MDIPSTQCGFCAWNGWISHLGVSKNRGTPKSSILIGFSIINHPFWGTPIFGNTHLTKRNTHNINFVLLFKDIYIYSMNPGVLLRKKISMFFCEQKSLGGFCSPNKIPNKIQRDHPKKSPFLDKQIRPKILTNSPRNPPKLPKDFLKKSVKNPRKKSHPPLNFVGSRKSLVLCIASCRSGWTDFFPNGPENTEKINGKKGGILYGSIFLTHILKIDMNMI